MNQFGSLRAKLQEKLPNLTLREQEPMAHHTTFRVGGPVPLMAFPQDEETLRQILVLCAQEGIRPFFLGKGSNLLVSDAGADVFVVKIAGVLTDLTITSAYVLTAGSGVSMAQAANFTAVHGLAGLEFAHGIPGTLGGGVFMNAGAYGRELSDQIIWVDCLDEQGNPHRLGPDALQLGYRHSVFSELPWLITRICLQCAPGFTEDIQEKIANLANLRRAKQPVEFPSAGSTFKRPEGHFAGALIEQCGLKGLRIGGAQVAEKHAGFIVNAGGATCEDILQLMRQVQETVEKRTGVRLEPEVRLLGCSLEKGK